MKRRRTRPQASTALVTDADRGSAIAIIRSLGRDGWRVIAADSRTASLGFRSRYAARRLVYPDPGADPRGFLETLAAEADRCDLIVPVTDEAIHVLARHRQRFEPRCKLAIADAGALGRVTDKSETIGLAGRLGVPVPRTRLVETLDDAQRAASELGWPVVLKAAVSPWYDADGGKLVRYPVAYANDPQEVAARFRYGPRPRVLVQEYWPGTGCGVEMLAAGGRVLAAFQHRRLAEIPVTGGASAWRESVPLDADLFHHAARLVEALCWTGLIMVEFKVGREPRLMEVNGRVWGSLPLAVASGMDFPARLAALYRDGAPPAGPPCTDYRRGIRAYNLELTVLWITQVLLGRRRYRYLEVPPRRRALSAALRMLAPASRFDIQSFDDPRPGWAELPRIARKLRRKLGEGNGAVA